MLDEMLKPIKAFIVTVIILAGLGLTFLGVYTIVEALVLAMQGFFML